MVLPLSFLLLVFLRNDLDQPRATTSSFGRGARSDASCTVEEFPIQRQDPKLWCQEQLSVLVKEDLSGVPKMLRMSHAIVSARYSAKIQVRCVAV